MNDIVNAASKGALNLSDEDFIAATTSTPDEARLLGALIIANRERDILLARLIEVFGQRSLEANDLADEHRKLADEAFDKGRTMVGRVQRVSQREAFGVACAFSEAQSIVAHMAQAQR
jgi:hypothetical protein